LELIILTNTIAVSDELTQVRRRDYRERLEDVVTATKAWINFAAKTKRRLVLIENSGSAEILRLLFSEIPGSQMEIIQAPSDIYSANQGISAGEFEMLRFTFSVIDFFQYEFIWKVSGRNYCKNAARVFKRYNKPDIIASRSARPAHLVSTRIFGMKPDLWADFVRDSTTFTSVADSFSRNSYSSMEHFLTQFVLDQEIKGKTQVDFPQIPRISGFSGSTNKVIDNKLRGIVLLLSNPFRKFVVKSLMGNTP
jgi:hypothetical protein